MNPLTLIIDLFPPLWPAWVKKLAAWASLAIAAALLLWAAWEALKGWIIEEEDEDRAVASMEQHNASAEQRAIDAVVNIAAENARESAVATAEASEAAKPASERAKLPPTTKALNCARMRQAYTKAELGRMDAYKANCM